MVYVKHQVVGFFIPKKTDEAICKVYRGANRENEAKDAYHELVCQGLNCFRAEIVAEHGE